MKRMKLTVWIAVLSFCISLPFALAGDDGFGCDDKDEDEKSQKSEWDYSALGKSEFGSVLYGPDFTKEQLKGKVVLIVYFGTRSGDTNALKDIAKLVAKYRKSGFVAIGINYFVKENDGRSIIDIAKELKIKSMPIVDYASTIAEGKKRKGVKKTSGVYVPYGILYGRNGSIIWERRYAGAQKEVTRLLNRELRKKESKPKKANDFEAILDGDDFPASAVIVKQIKAGRLWAAYRKCEKCSDGKGNLSVEATQLKELLEKYHEQQIELVETQKTDAPTDAMQTLKSISKTFRGTKFAVDAKKSLAELKKDKEFQSLLKSYRKYGRIMKAIKKIPAPPADDDGHKKWKRKYKSRIAGAARQVEMFGKKHPDSRYTKKLEDAMLPLDTEM